MKRLIFSLLLFSAFYFGTNNTFAQCRCEPRLTVQEHFQKSDVVFIGKVIEAKKIAQKDSEDIDTIVVKFEVIRTWKQDLEKIVTVKELYGDIRGLETSAELLLYARKDKDGNLYFFRGCCQPSGSVSQDALATFRQMGEKPKKIIEN